MSVTAAAVSFGFSSPEYGGSFDFGFTVPQYLLVMAIVGAVGIVPYWHLKVHVCRFLLVILVV